VQRLHARIANVRQDFLHKASSAIAQVHALVVVEDLQVRSMSASAKGTAQQPGKNVLAKASLNKAILDQGWAEFRRQLEYKLVWGGGELIAVDPRNTSRTCPECGHVDAQNRQTQAVFRCVACGHQAHADVVGAINILARGTAQQSVERSSVAPGPRPKVEGQACSLSEAGTHRGDHGRLCLLWRGRNPPPLGRGGCQGEALDLQVQ
jgi:putative transposase